MKKAYWLIFKLRMYAVLEVLFSPCFKLHTYFEDYDKKSNIYFDLKELKEAGRKGRL